MTSPLRAAERSQPARVVRRGHELVVTSYGLGSQVVSARLKRGHWACPASPAAAGDLSEALPSAAWDEGADLLRAAWHRQQWAAERWGALERRVAPEVPVSRAAPAWRHQRNAYHFAEPAAGCLMYVGLGAGKTRITFDLIEGRDHRLTLVVAPKAVLPNWEREAGKIGARVRVCVLDRGSLKRRAEKAREMVARSRARNERIMLVINYEAAWREAFASWALEAGFDLVVADEVQKIKAPGGRASRFMGRLARVVPFRIGLSGTPCPHSPLDAYGVFRFVDVGVFGSSFARFKGRYSVSESQKTRDGRQYSQVVGYKNEDEYRKRFYSVTFRVERDVLDLPDAQHVEREAGLPPSVAQIYRELRDEMIAEIAAATHSGESAFAVATNALTRLLRLQQISSGFLEVAAPGEPAQLQELHTGKRDLLVAVLEELAPEEPVVVFCRFRRDLDSIAIAAAKAGRESLELSGRCNQLAEWQAGAAAVLAVQIQSGGAGIDLTRACYCVYFSLNHSLGDYDQSLARVHRPGQSRPVTFVHLTVRETVDQQIYRALQERRDLLEEILRDPRVLDGGQAPMEEQ